MPSVALAVPHTPFVQVATVQTGGVGQVDVSVPVQVVQPLIGVCVHELLSQVSVVQGLPSSQSALTQQVPPTTQVVPQQMPLEQLAVVQMQLPPEQTCPLGQLSTHVVPEQVWQALHWDGHVPPHASSPHCLLVQSEQHDWQVPLQQLPVQHVPPPLQSPPVLMQLLTH